MNVTIERDALLKAVARAQGVVDRHHSMVVLTNVLLHAEGNTLSVVATDLEVSLRQRVEAKVKKAGAAAVSARTFFEIIREAPSGDVYLATTENQWLEASYGKSRFKLMGADPNEHPGMAASEATTENGTSLSMKSEALAEMIRKTLFAVSTDDTRSNLAGVYLDRGDKGKIRFVATDGHRLAVIDRATSGSALGGGAIMPRKGLAEVGKLLGDCGGEVNLSITDSEAVVHVGDVVLSMRLVEGSFPDYEKVLPAKSEKIMEADRDALLQTLRRVSILSSERARGVRFELSDGTLEIRANNPDLGEANEQFDVDYHGEAVSVGFNARYLLDVLTVLPEGSRVSIGLGDELSPGVVRGEDDGYRYVVMPMRI